MDRDLADALLSGLEEPDRARTEEIIRGQVDADRSAALDGKPARQVDVTIRSRARRKHAADADS